MRAKKVKKDILSSKDYSTAGLLKKKKKGTFLK